MEKRDKVLIKAAAGSLLGITLFFVSALVRSSAPSGMAGAIGWGLPFSWRLVVGGPQGGNPVLLLPMALDFLFWLGLSFAVVFGLSRIPPIYADRNLSPSKTR